MGPPGGLDTTIVPSKAASRRSTPRRPEPAAGSAPATVSVPAACRTETEAVRAPLWGGVPLQMFLFLVALGVDYTIFLMTRAREEAVRRGHREGVLHALAVTGGVITSAGVVLAATFAALNVLPLVPSVQVAVIVSVGVLLDTLLVRSLLVPALSIHIGRKTWWPSRSVSR